MSRHKLVVLACVLAAAAVTAGCGSGGSGKWDGVKVPQTAGVAQFCSGVMKNVGNVYCGAVLFNQHCSGCHTIDAANTQGSRPSGNVNVNERTNGPNFNVRHENREDVLYAIRNGGFSGAIMPANVVVGQDAQDIALFLERYAGEKAPANQTPTSVR